MFCYRTDDFVDDLVHLSVVTKHFDILCKSNIQSWLAILLCTACTLVIGSKITRKKPQKDAEWCLDDEK